MLCSLFFTAGFAGKYRYRAVAAVVLCNVLIEMLILKEKR